MLGGLLTATLLLASFVLAVIAMLYPQRPFGERLSYLQADAFFFVLALGGLLGLASLWTVVGLGHEAVNCSPVLLGRERLDPVRSDGGLLLIDLIQSRGQDTISNVVCMGLLLGGRVVIGVTDAFLVLFGYREPERRHVGRSD